ncbi:ferredoxin reductase domain-containing protein [Wolbachia endosymbiont of Dirofilaria (Dirofilaria) immitis]|uniref:oxidoreductase n=1 Tax=Wolbachia endosymbiont of Dirofilaria (Dirofilaria) immitis TaxID=1812115 RepID=UPI00158D7E14|nr:oxidoreductase [Wolbachia endosymbiont of Dirofilaria (Dirofilaria) immitis]QKX02085.1 oxidoreductase [Wolbachia endosymbiont of Dirofilaria (Dirofilaria) immitis]
MKNIMLVGGGVGNAVLFLIGKAHLKNNSKVLYFAGYRKLNGVFKQALIECASSAVVWACEEGLIKINRGQDRSFHGNIVDAIISYQQGKLGDTIVNLDAIDKIIAIGSDKMMKAINEARKTILKPYLKSSHVAISSINSPMQCMMKGICAQCVQRHINLETEEESFVYSCSNQDQNMEFVDFDFLSERLRQNSLQEKLTAKWIDYAQRC